MVVTLNRWPDGRNRALTLSYDDGTVHDQRLVETMDRHGVRGTFHLNSGRLDTAGALRADEVAGLFARHEVSVHTVTHPHLPDLPPGRVAWEILEDRKALERLVGYPVRGMSYPYGTCSDAVARLLPSLGIEYARTVESHQRFGVPHDLLRWPATCHHKRDLMKLADAFLAVEKPNRLCLMYVWGHSYEFEREGNWDLIEGFCDHVGGRDDTWYATNIEIADYLWAVRALRFGADGDLAHNPSAVAVWLEADGEVTEVGPGCTVRLGQGAET